MTGGLTRKEDGAANACNWQDNVGGCNTRLADLRRAQLSEMQGGRWRWGEVGDAWRDDGGGGGKSRLKDAVREGGVWVVRQIREGGWGNA